MSYNYQPYYPAYSYQPQQMQTQTQQNTNLMTVFVNTESEVNDYPVAAGLTVQLISFPLGKFWLKSTATNGVPMPLRTFSFVEEEAKTDKETGVTRKEFDDLSHKIDKLLKELGGEADV